MALNFGLNLGSSFGLLLVLVRFIEFYSLKYIEMSKFMFHIMKYLKDLSAHSELYGLLYIMSPRREDWNLIFSSVRVV